MAEQTPKLTLGFVGPAEVHRTNALALLKDLVGGFMKQHRKAEVLVLLEALSEPDAPSTDTMSDIMDWAQTSGYEVYEVKATELVTELLKEDDARLILVGDPNEDDIVYAVAEEAAQNKIPTRSLINGLEKVVFDDEEPDELGDGFHEVDLADPDAGIDFPEDSDLDDDLAGTTTAEPDLDVLADLADGGEVEAQEEIKSIAAGLGIDATPFDTWTEAVAAIRGNGGTPDETPKPEEDPDPTPEAPSPDAEAAEPTTSEQEDSAGASAPEEEPADDPRGKVYTREELEAKEFAEVKAIALEWGIAPGRGMKHSVFVNKILAASGVEEAAPSKPKSKTKKEAAPPPLAAVPDPEPEPPAEESVVVPIRAADERTVEKIIAEGLRDLADKLDPPDLVS